MIEVKAESTNNLESLWTCMVYANGDPGYLDVYWADVIWYVSGQNEVSW